MKKRPTHITKIWTTKMMMKGAKSALNLYRWRWKRVCCDRAVRIAVSREKLGLKKREMACYRGSGCPANCTQHPVKMPDATMHLRKNGQDDDEGGEISVELVQMTLKSGVLRQSSSDCSQSGETGSEKERNGMLYGCVLPNQLYAKSHRRA